MNLLKIENNKFDDNKWKGKGWEFEKNFILCGLNKKLKQK
jgi:hypothetical protein